MKLFKKISSVVLSAAIIAASVFIANPKESYAATSCEKVLKKNVTYKYDIDGDRDLDTIKIYTSSGDLKIKVNKCVKTLISYDPDYQFDFTAKIYDFNKHDKSKEIVFEKNYALPIVYEFIGNANKNGKNVNIFLKNVDIFQQKKGKQRKRNISLSSPPTPPTGESEENTGLKAFLESHPNIEVDGYNGKIADMDFDRLTAAIAESDYLKEVTSFLWLCNQYEKIISGYFKTIKTTAKEKGGAKPAENWTDVLARL